MSPLRKRKSEGLRNLASEYVKMLLRVKRDGGPDTPGVKKAYRIVMRRVRSILFQADEMDASE